MFDYFSAYKNVIRNVVLRKSNIIVNCNEIPFIIKVIYSFRLYKLEDLNDVQIYNYLYFFKFFFGRKGVLTKYKSFFNLGIWTYNFRVCMYVCGYKNIYNNIYCLFFEYLINIDKNLVTFKYYLNVTKFYYILVKELTFFSERKTNIGLFNLYSNLLIMLNFSSKNLILNKILTKNMKLVSNNLWYFTK